MRDGLIQLYNAYHLHFRVVLQGSILLGVGKNGPPLTPANQQ